MANFFIDLFAKSAALYGSKPAVHCQGDYLTYGGLNALADAIAGALQGAGVRRGDIVPIHLEAGLAPLAGILGVWKAGAAFCPVGTDAEPELLRQIAGECSARLILDRAWLDGQTLNQEPLVVTAENLPSIDDLAMVFFTPDAEGHRRGAMIPHRTLSLAVQGNARSFTDQDVFLSLFPYDYIGMVADTLTPLALGATLHVAAGGVAGDLPALVRYIKDNGITFASLAPGDAAAYLDRADGDLRTLFVGMARVGGLFSVFTRIVNVYGQAETCGPVTSAEIDRPYLNAPIGGPYAGTGLYLLDKNLNRVNAGETGEICLSGQIASGYLNDPDLTRQKFVANPFGLGEEDGKLFLTGDLGRVDPESGMLFVEERREHGQNTAASAPRGNELMLSPPSGVTNTMSSTRIPPEPGK